MTSLVEYPYTQQVGLLSEDAKSLSTKTGTALQSANTARLPATVLLMSVSPLAAIVFDLLVMNLLILQMLEGPIMTYPELILSWTSSLSFSPINIDNPFESWSESAPCEATDTMVRLKVGCLFLYNYGEDIIVLSATLLVNILIGLAGHVILKSTTTRDSITITPSHVHEPDSSLVIFSPPAVIVTSA